ncbi:unnamed protein product [Adineta steineri]|uniref:CBM21 domain-containing protein n=1 Tax=Adineta steineri TaxID=433720 RepID=A0A819F5P0_9BILA|nr:unnamed protein product [Adineta steineri]
MSLNTKQTNDNDRVDAPFLLSNDKVIHYLQNSRRCSNNNNNNNNDSLNVLHKSSSHTHDLFFVKDSSMNNNHNNNNNHQQQSEQRIRSCSEDGSSSSVNDTLSRSDFSLGSSLSDPGGFCSIFSSNTSSSGICSTFSDVGHEENTSTSSEELDFNLGFDQISDNDDIEVANLDEINDDDECEYNDKDDQQMTTENSVETATLLDRNDSNLDARISELEEFLRKSYNSTNIDDYEFNNDDTITAHQTKQRASFLHDSTYTLCPQDRFSAYTDGDDHEDEHIANGIGIRSNSLGIVPSNRKAVLINKPPKKVVRFADKLGLDLESIRYMTPPDQSTNSLIQECIRIKLEQLRVAKNQSSISSLSQSPFDLAANSTRTPSSSTLSASTKSSKQYYLVSKYFTSPTNIIPLVYERQVMLECLYTKDSIAYGTVRVHNCAYDKRIFARITDNEWETYQDNQAWHSMNYTNTNTDTFTFEIRLGKYNNDAKVPKQIYFAICLQAMCQEYWDNNLGWNYLLDVIER